MTFLRFIETHHEKLGAALFILPCLLVPFVAAGVVYAAVLLFQ